MLRISKLTDYGTLILAHMAGLPGRLHSAAELAEALGLGLPTVSKVLKTLGRHALVSSQRGAHGGYVLTRAAEQITVADIIDALEDQPFGLTECSASAGVCSMESDCRIRDNWLRINTVVRQALQSVTVADMVHPDEPSPLARGLVSNEPASHRMHGPARLGSRAAAASLAACIPTPRADDQEI
ncbi:SUF system Fe-S cluster assembly regulator [Thauera sp. JM12B12]|uniref:SUF system Fe-S cluster assembly regulator n=1 Tax=Thauera sp. JM12B12 TaxID=3142262 RepID=UPI0031F436D2